MIKKAVFWIAICFIFLRGMMLFNPTKAWSEAIVQYQMLTNLEETEFREVIWYWGSDTTFQQVYRSNDYIGIKYSRHLEDIDFYMITAKEIYGGWDPDDPWRERELPPNLIEDAPEYQFKDLSYLADSADVTLGEAGYTTRLHFDGAEGIKVTYYESGNPPRGEFEDNDVDITLDPDEVRIIYVETECEVYGIVVGQFTIYCDRNIWLLDDIRYEGSNELNGSFDPDEVDHMLALVSEKNILIQNNYRNGRDNGWGNYEPDETDKHSININGSLVALGESFTFDQQNDGWEPYQGPSPDERGYINLTGGVAQYRRGYAHRSNHVGTGYNKNYKWDTRLDQRVPPGFRAGLVIDCYGYCPVLYLPGGQYQIMPYKVQNATIGELYIDSPPNVAFEFSESSSMAILDTLSLRGTFQDKVTFFTNDSVDVDESQARVVISGSSQMVNASFWEGIEVQFGDAEHVVDSSIFRGNVVVNGQATFSNCTFWGDITSEELTDVRFVNCTFEASDSLTEIRDIYDLTIDVCDFKSAVRISGSTLNISDNNFTQHTHVTSAHYLFVRRNLFLDGMVADAPYLYGGEIRNNVFVGSDSTGMDLNVELHLPVKNNIVAWNRTGIVRSGMQPTLAYNNVYANGDSDYVNCEPGEGSISADPLFVNPDFGDYHLQWGSPCIDAGDPDSPSDPDGSPVEMGRYYYDHELKVEVEEPVLPERISFDTYPNPFNNKLFIKTNLQDAQTGLLQIFDMRGRLVSKQELSHHSDGIATVYGQKLGTAGIYLIRLEIGGQVEHRKVIYLK